MTRLVEGIVSPPSSTLGYTNLISHSIEVQGARSVRCVPRRMSPRMLEVAQGEVQKMLAAGVIEPFSTEWCSGDCEEVERRPPSLYRLSRDKQGHAA